MQKTSCFPRNYKKFIKAKTAIFRISVLLVIYPPPRHLEISSGLTVIKVVFITSLEISTIEGIFGQSRKVTLGIDKLIFGPQPEGRGG